MANERLRALEDVEKEIAMILQCAGKDIFHQTAQLLHTFVFVLSIQFYLYSADS